MKKAILLFSVCSVVFLSACIKDQEERIIRHYSEDEYNVLIQELDLPLFPYQYPDFAGVGSFNGEFNDRATLGRVLFYDKRLSANNTVSCASCHKQELAFADDKALSEGFEGEPTKRNSLALGAVLDFKTSYGGSSSLNSLDKPKFFWDERAETIMEQSEETIKNAIEMGTTDLNKLAEELLVEEFYQILFEKAFPENFMGNMPNDRKILTALEDFINAIVSKNSRFDAGLKTAPVENNFSNFSLKENQGKELFMTHCASCHGDRATIVAVNSASNGLDLAYEDNGVGERTSKISDMGVFKVPMLRNIALTGPYMHDGRFATLEEVVDHYNSGLKAHNNLHPLLKAEDGSPKQLNLTNEEKEALVDFLQTLTDVSTIMHEKFADPFR